MLKQSTPLLMSLGATTLLFLLYGMSLESVSGPIYLKPDQVPKVDPVTGTLMTAFAPEKVIDIESGAFDTSREVAFV